ncbi:hypothetical protein RND81_11G062300 [Saponaria officinalis]|uniref:Uncharacterized protein n=1 Tax=Saponaria officinalis TaxID=3572 RepID=A0AAW1HIZ4_SAPOF
MFYIFYILCFIISYCIILLYTPWQNFTQERPNEKKTKQTRVISVIHTKQNKHIIPKNFRLLLRLSPCVFSLLPFAVFLPKERSSLTSSSSGTITISVASTCLLQICSHRHLLSESSPSSPFSFPGSFSLHRLSPLNAVTTGSRLCVPDCDASRLRDEIWCRTPSLGRAFSSFRTRGTGDRG